MIAHSSTHFLRYYIVAGVPEITFMVFKIQFKPFIWSFQQSTVAKEAVGLIITAFIARVTSITDCLRCLALILVNSTRPVRFNRKPRKYRHFMVDYSSKILRLPAVTSGLFKSTPCLAN